ncbi:RNA 2',3'-cyclic phosphodiesterase [Bacillus sp. FJAT-22090]|uniref:RNA 2',3'-cyclic phosphodiesterase n=1 Tax=Bacillus sp. FJAT-22090 TaxID=1581038 RepID=UPI0011A7D81C|nr:RNA 2',3'-cyclic phosphodiesterase [Bacillus sp. FJAT-22090]
MKKHYFIGIKVPEDTGIPIVKERAKTNVKETHKVLPVAEDLHITLYYLGHVEEDILSILLQALRDIQWDPFTLTTSGLSHFGNAETPRVLYTALEASEPLHLLQKEVVQVLSETIEVKDANDFTAHITIAKKWAAAKPLNIKDFQLAKMHFDVSHFSIFKINNDHLPRYEEIHSIHCRGV